MKLNDFFKTYMEIELTTDQEKHIMEFLGIKEPKPKRWKPNRDETYFYLDSSGMVSRDVYYPSHYEDFRYLGNNMFKTREEAEFHSEKLKVYHELKLFADENNDEIDWNNEEQSKYFIDYYHRVKEIFVNKYVATQILGTIHFSSLEVAHQAIERVGADRIKKYLFEVE